MFFEVDGGADLVVQISPGAAQRAHEMHEEGFTSSSIDGIRIVDVHEDALLGRHSNLVYQILFASFFAVASDVLRARLTVHPARARLDAIRLGCDEGGHVFSVDQARQSASLDQTDTLRDTPIDEQAATEVIGVLRIEVLIRLFGNRLEVVRSVDVVLEAHPRTPSDRADTTRSTAA